MAAHLTNNGPDTADAVRLTDVVPAGTTFVSFAVPSPAGRRPRHRFRAPGRCRRPRRRWLPERRPSPSW
ncbi:DUF11 domain-containing protein [Streptomyces sp. NRRL S-813]|uniref:DUF11 domain-containing protein n=1 Tax=Streptomyces sp. NRRL S-813 TaxID=1463919 RepID=UPI00099D544D